MTGLEFFGEGLEGKIELRNCFDFGSGKVVFVAAMFDSKHVRFFEGTLASLLHGIFLREHLPFFLSSFNCIHEALFGIFIVVFNRVIVITLDVDFEFGGGGVVVVGGDADPRELDPDPSFVVVKGGFYLAESVILFYFLEGDGRQGVGVVGYHA